MHELEEQQRERPGGGGFNWVEAARATSKTNGQCREKWRNLSQAARRGWVRQERGVHLSPDLRRRIDALVAAGR